MRIPLFLRPKDSLDEEGDRLKLLLKEGRLISQKGRLHQSLPLEPDLLTSRQLVQAMEPQHRGQPTSQKLLDGLHQSLPPVQPTSQKQPILPEEPTADQLTSLLVPPRRQEVLELSRENALLRGELSPGESELTLGL